jgi:hypothetical protein
VELQGVVPQETCLMKNMKKSIIFLRKCSVQTTNSIFRRVSCIHVGSGVSDTVIKSEKEKGEKNPKVVNKVAQKSITNQRVKTGLSQYLSE